MVVRIWSAEQEDGGHHLPRRLGFSGKNSERTGSTQPCLRMMGLTREAILWRVRRAWSAFGRSLRWVKDLTKISGMDAVKGWCVDARERTTRVFCRRGPL